MGYVVKVFAVCTGLMMILSLGCAASYEFGSKVRSGDVDEGDTLIPVLLSVYWLNTMVVASFDPSDVAYLHQGPSSGTGFVLPNDIRLTPFLGHPAGSRVKMGDHDVGMAITSFLGTSPGWSFSELFIGNSICDIDEPVYYQADPGANLAVTDLRLSKLQWLNPGSWVKDSDPDFDNPTVPLAAVIMYHEASTPGYDDSDHAYLKINAADNVSPGDLRLIALNGQN